MSQPLQIFGNGLALAVFVLQHDRLPKKSELDISGLSAGDLLEAAQNISDNHPLSKKLWSSGIRRATVADLATISSSDLERRHSLVYARLRQVGSYQEVFDLLTHTMIQNEHDRPILDLLKRKVKNDYEKMHFLIIDLGTLYQSFDENARFQSDFKRIPKDKQKEYRRKFRQLLSLISQSFLTLEAYDKLVHQFIGYPESNIWNIEQIFKAIYLRAKQSFDLLYKTVDDFNHMFEIINWTCAGREAWQEVFELMVDECDDFSVILFHYPDCATLDWRKANHEKGLEKLRSIGTLQDWILCFERSFWQETALQAMFDLARSNPPLWAEILSFGMKTQGYPSIRERIVAEIARQLQ